MNRHDTEAIPLARDAWGAFGYELFPNGTENDHPRLREALLNMRDPTARLLRWRPDFVLAKSGCRVMYCEIKSEGNGYPNFAIEAHSYLSIRGFVGAGFAGVYVFVDLNEASTLCCWTTDIPVPEAIRVPQRDGWRETVVHLRSAFPNVRMTEEPFRGWAEEGGRKSGTPYFLVSKRAGFLQPVPLFVQQHRLLSPPPLPQAGTAKQTHPDSWQEEWRCKRVMRMWKSIRDELPGNVKLCLLDSEPLTLVDRVLTIGLQEHLLPGYKPAYGLEIARAIKQVADVTCSVRAIAKRRAA